MGWGEPMRSRRGDALAAAVSAYLDHPTTRNRQAMAEALSNHEKSE